MARRAFKVRPVRTADYFIVGDSTAAAVQNLVPTRGMAVSGVGYTPESASGFWHGMPATPALAYRAPNASPVVFFASVWDIDAVDLSPYSTAVAYFESFGLPVVVWGIPPMELFGGSPVTEAEAATFNAALATELGRSLDNDGLDRYVSIADGTSDDDTHPNQAGADLISARIIRAVGFADDSRLRGSNMTTLRGELGPTVYGRSTAAGVGHGASTGEKATAAVTVAAGVGHSRVTGAKATTAVTRAAGVAGGRLAVTSNRAVTGRMPGPLVTSRATAEATRTGVAQMAGLVAARPAVSTSRPSAGRLGVLVAATAGATVQASVDTPTPSVGAVLPAARIATIRRAHPA